MDIRDISEKVIYPGSRALDNMFELQLVLVDYYTGIESLPAYPIDINTKQGQNLIKDFSARIIEELGEGFESYGIMVSMFNAGENEDNMIPMLQNFNEEVSDAIHFWLELMIFSGFDVNSMAGWLSDPIFVNNLLERYFALGKSLLEFETNGKRYPGRWVIKDHQLNDEFLRGGRLLGTDRMNKMKELLWDITYYLQIARNTLKNKPWKQTGMVTDVKQYEGAMAGATMALFKFMAFTGFSPESLYEIYYKKNKINQWRVKSKY